MRTVMPPRRARAQCTTILRKKPQLSDNSLAGRGTTAGEMHVRMSEETVAEQSFTGSLPREPESVARCMGMGSSYSDWRIRCSGKSSCC